MTENKRFRKGKSILTDFPTGAIIDEETGERYYDGIKPSYISSMELVELLNELAEENKDLEEARSYYQENFLTMKTERHQLKEENRQLQSKLEQYERIMSDFDVSSFDELRTIMEQGCGV